MPSAAVVIGPLWVNASITDCTFNVFREKKTEEMEPEDKEAEKQQETIDNKENEVCVILQA